MTFNPDGTPHWASTIIGNMPKVIDFVKQLGDTAISIHKAQAGAMAQHPQQPQRVEVQQQFRALPPPVQQQVVVEQPQYQPPPVRQAPPVVQPAPVQAAPPPVQAPPQPVPPPQPPKSFLPNMSSLRPMGAS
jgi:hypothetical protein